MALTDLHIKRAAPQLKDIWLTDEKGLRLLIKPNGSRYWRLRYRFAGKQKTLALGIYPDISLKQARLDRDAARQLLSKNIDPSEVKKEKKLQNSLHDLNLFSVLAKEWWENQKGTWTPDHANRVWIRLRDNSFDLLDKKPIGQIVPKDVIAVTKKIEKRDALDVARRVLQDVRRVFRYGVQIGRLKINPAIELQDVIKTRKTQHRPSMQNQELGSFLVELARYNEKGRDLTRLATQMLVYTFVRSGELRGARWSEFDFANQLWRVPETRMKMRTEHLVPLSKQVLSILLQVQRITGEYELVFPSERNRNEPMSDNTMRRAIHRLGYDGNTAGKSKAVPHGFRANASSILNEKGFNPDAIERQLSHVERNGVRAAYLHHARFMDERQDMMQWWADYLDDATKSAQ
jgi:integrase